MSVCRKLPDGTIQKIAGHTILLDANASEVRTGRWNLVSAGAGWVEQSITFTDPMPDTDYVVIIESDNQSWAEQPGPYRITNKTTTGFILASYNRPNASMNIAGTYTAWKPVKIEGYTELQNKINNPDETPTEDSTNLCTSGGIYEAIKNASAVWKGTKSEWTALPVTDKKSYDLAVLVDAKLIKAVDRTDGSDTDVADLGQIWKGTRTEWESLSLAERKTHGVAFFTDKRYAVSVDPTTGDESNLVDWTGVWKGSMEDWEALTDEEKDEWDVCITPTIAASDTNPFRTLSDPEALSVAPNTDYTCPHDGFITIESNSGDAIMVNGIRIGRNNTGDLVTIPVQKGDVVRCDGNATPACVARWYTNEVSPGEPDTPVLYRSQALDWDNKVYPTNAEMLAGWTAPADGYFIDYSIPASGINALTINGIQISYSKYDGNFWSTHAVQIPVAKGDVLKHNYSMYSWANSVIFVPYKDYPDYSTAEHWTGRRWIDGKKIYSRVLTCQETKTITVRDSVAGVTDVIKSLPIETFLYGRQFADFYTGERICFDSPSDGTIITSAAGAGIYIVNGGHICIEYTKTTDD